MDETPATPTPEAPAPTQAGAEEPFVRSPSRVAMLGALLAIAIGSLVGVALALANRTGGVLPPLKPGWTRHSLSSRGFSVDLSPGWRAVSTTSGQEQFDALKEANPQLAALIQTPSGPTVSSLITLLAFDVDSPTIASGFATNATVAVVPLANATTFDSFLNDNLRQLRNTPGVASTIDTQLLELPAGQAALVHARFTSQPPNEAQVSTISQYLLLRGSRGYILSFSTLPSNLNSYSAVFDGIARTFRFV